MAAPRVTIDQLPEQTVIDGADLLVIQDGATTKKMTVSRILDSSTTSLTAHLNDTSGAHAASSISATPNVAGVVGADVQTQLSQLATAVEGLATRVNALETQVSSLETRVTALETP